jgi:hypothetical protein
MAHASKNHRSLLLILIALVGLVLPASAVAQQRSRHHTPDKQALYRYAGVYVLPSGAYLAVEVSGEALAVQPTDVSIETVADAEDVEALRALDRDSEAILAGLTRGRTGPLQAALPEHRRAEGAADIQRLFDVFADAHGAVQGYRVLGTVADDVPRAWTLARIDFAEGHEVVRLTWHRGMLSTIQRGALPVTGQRPASVVRFRQTSSDPAGTIAFNVRPNGSVASLTIKGPHGTVVAYKLADASAMASGK